MGLFLLLNSPSALLGFPLISSFLCVLHSGQWAFLRGLSTWVRTLSLCPCPWSPQDVDCLTLEDRLLAPLISPLLCLGGTEACLMNRSWVRSLGVLFRLDCAVHRLHAAIQRKAESVFCRSGFSFHECVWWARVPCLREKIMCFNILHVSLCQFSFLVIPGSHLLLDLGWEIEAKSAFASPKLLFSPRLIS